MKIMKCLRLGIGISLILLFLGGLGCSSVTVKTTVNLPENATPEQMKAGVTVSVDAQVTRADKVVINTTAKLPVDLLPK